MTRWLMAGLLLASAFAADPRTLRVKLTPRDGGRLATLALEDYVAAVVAGEAASFRSDEALKAMAVAARTYAVRLRGRHATDGYDLCGLTHCQVIDLRGVSPRIRAVVSATSGELIWYEGAPALAYYSQNCGGRTEDASSLWAGPSVPYLRPQADPYCRRAGAPSSTWQWISDSRQLGIALRNFGIQTPPSIERITVVNRTGTGRNNLVALAGAGQSFPVNANVMRQAVGRQLGWNTMKSERWDVRGDDGHFLFQGSGSGHGAGLCQIGADEMGVEGQKYRDILTHYYPGTVVGVTAKGINWRRIGGERVALMTTQPGRDARVLSLGEQMARSMGLAPTIEIRVYPDVETFRNATAEPGWVAAYTSGRRIHLQPLSGATLERTLRHEMLHVMVGDRATASLPVWFQEGLVGYLETRDDRTGALTPTDADMRQNVDVVRARRSYEDARRRVATLVKTYGESAVMDWLTRGLPSAVPMAAGL